MQWPWYYIPQLCLGASYAICIETYPLAVLLMHNTGRGATQAAGPPRPRTTSVCGVVSPARPPITRIPGRSTFHGPRYFRKCPICLDGIKDARGVFMHFRACVTQNGNPAGLSWYSHPSIDVASLPASLLQ